MGSRTSAPVMELVTSFAEDMLLFHSMTAEESLGRLSKFDISALSARPDLDTDALLGRPVTVRLEVPFGEPRRFNAVVTRFALAGTVGRHFRYEIAARPWLWLLTQTSDCRIFQHQTVPEIAKTIFAKYPEWQYELRLTEKYMSREYCVQYRESDFDFVSRLFEQEGIYYFFEHLEGSHKLVLADSWSVHNLCVGYEQVPYAPEDRGTVRSHREAVTHWIATKRVRPVSYEIDDYDFERPRVELEQRYKVSRKHHAASGAQYDYPGGYVQRVEGEHYVRTRLEALQCEHELCEGITNVRGLLVGGLFALTGHPTALQNREYVVTAARVHMTHGGHESMDAEGASFQCSFTAIPSREQFRPARTTPRARVDGPQTAVVVGSEGDEIHTDRYGRVKVQFHWDRYGQKNENSSCWVRVSHPWAGRNWGMVAIPRVGQEVIVDFLEGDPDRPIITGRVYNAEQMPPYELPANQTQSGIKTRSTSAGNGANFNEIRFEDRKGAEQLYVHAERNQDNVVENDETTAVGHDRTETVGHDESISIGANRNEHVGANEAVTIGGNRTHTTMIASAETVGAAKALTIGAAYAVSIGGAMNTAVGLGSFEEVGLTKEVVVGKTLRIQAGDRIELVCGKSVLVLRQDGMVNLNGKDIDITGDAHIQLGAERIDIN